MSIFSVRGKYLFENDRKFIIKGVAYGTFPPEETEGRFFPDPDQVRRDFQLMSAANINSVRVYIQPPDYVMDIARDFNLRMLLGMYIDPTIDFRARREIARYQELVKGFVAWAGQHENVALFSLGNEIPQAAVVNYGKLAIETFLLRMVEAAKEVDGELPITFSTFPPTEFLDLTFLDLVTLNVYIYRKEGFRDYISRMHNQIGGKPLLMGEIGADTLREGYDWQAGLLKWKIRAALELGCAGSVVFTFCDGWWAGEKVTDWKMGILEEDRSLKTAYYVVQEEFGKELLRLDEDLPRATVVVASHNAEDHIAHCLESLLDLDYPNKEIIVVADGCTDRTAEIAQEYPVRVIQQPRAGLSVARNVGHAAATGSIVAYTDADCRVDRDWLYHLVKSFDRPEIGAAGGPNLTPADDPFIAQCVGLAPGCATHVLIDDVYAEHVPGCNMAYRKSALEEVGGFDPRLTIAADDVDIGWRMEDAGYAVKYHPGAQVFHHRRDSVKAYFLQQLFYGASGPFLRVRHPARFAGPNPLWRGRVYGITPSLLASLLHRPRIHMAPFPYIYHPAPGGLSHLPMSLPFYAAWFLCLVAGLLGSFTSLAVGAGLLALTLACCVEVAIRGRRARSFPRSQRVKAFLAISLLSFLWPLARGIGHIWGCHLVRRNANVVKDLHHESG